MGWIVRQQGFFFWTSVPLLALLHGPNFGGMTAGSSDSDTSSEISPEKNPLKGSCESGASRCAISAHKVGGL